MEKQGSKSGQKFFISKDGRYMKKTTPRAEAKKLLQVVKFVFFVGVHLKRMHIIMK